MGNALKAGVRTVQRFNAENRAHRLLDKDKVGLRPAPRHPTTAKAIKELQQRNPDVLEKQQKKDERLLGFLQNVRVDSTDPEQPKPLEGAESKASGSSPQRRLPTSRKPLPKVTTMFEVPDEVPEGSLTVPMALEILAKHKRNPKEWPAERLAADYKLDLTDTTHILEYFRSFKVIPVEGSTLPPPRRLLGR